jgi:hypothetical protein
MQQVKAAKADQIGDNIDPGPIDVGVGYQDWVGRFRNKLKIHYRCRRCSIDIR